MVLGTQLLQDGEEGLQPLAYSPHGAEDHSSCCDFGGDGH